MKYYVTLDGREIEVDVEGDLVRVDGRELRAHLGAVPGTPLSHLLLDDHSVTLTLTSTGRGMWEIGRLGEHWPVEVVDERTRHIQRLTGAGEGPKGPARLAAPMPGLVVKVEVKEGQQVKAGRPLVVLEAMKMQNELRSPADGVVARVHVRAGQAVEKGAVLVEFG